MIPPADIARAEAAADDLDLSAVDAQREYRRLDVHSPSEPRARRGKRPPRAHFLHLNPRLLARA